MGFASYLERIREIADEAAPDRRGNARPAPRRKDAKARWTPHYQPAPPKPAPVSRFSRAVSKLTKKETELLKALFDAAHEYVHAQSDQFRHLFDKDKAKRREAKRRFDDANERFRQSIRALLVELLRMAIEDRRKIHEVGSIYIADQLVRSYEGFVGPFEDEMKRVSDALGLPEDEALE